MRRFFFWGALPLVLPQALRLRRTALRLPPPPGPACGRVGEGRELRLLAVGDSIAAGVGARTYEQTLVGRLARELSMRLQCAVSWRAAGRSGATTCRILERVVRRLETEPADVILLTTGVNDVTGLLRSSAFRKNMDALLEGLVQHSPGATIAVVGVPPLERFPLLPQPLRGVLALRARQFDEIARAAASRRANALHVPVRIESPESSFAQDGFHPSEDGYRRLAEATTAPIVCALQSKRESRPA